MRKSKTWMNYVISQAGENIFVPISNFLNSESQIMFDRNKYALFIFSPLNRIVRHMNAGEHVVGESGSNMRQ
jgi:hypothetical protein